MAPTKFLACTVCAVTLFTTACADGTGKALTPTLPSDSPTANLDGTRLKASAPQPSSPRASARVSNLTPLLRLENAAGTYETAALTYDIEVLEGSTRVSLAEGVAPATETATGWTVPANTLKLNKTYGWRARAVFNGVPGSWSETALFRTPVPENDGPGPVFCAGSSGPEIIRCVANAYPEKLVKTSGGDFSDERRAANMEFIRDRIIETGKCKGMNLGQNFKRGTPVISKDFIVLRSERGKGGRDRGVDIARGYDATSSKLQLSWQVFDADENWGHPFYKDYGPVDCSGVN